MSFPDVVVRSPGSFETPWAIDPPIRSPGQAHHVRSRALESVSCHLFPSAHVAVAHRADAYGPDEFLQPGRRS